MADAVFRVRPDLGAIEGIRRQMEVALRGAQRPIAELNRQAARTRLQFAQGLINRPRLRQEVAELNLAKARLREMGAATRGLRTALTGTVTKLAALAGGFLIVRRIARTFSAAARAGIELNKQLEAMRVGVAATVAGQARIVDQFGRTLAGAEKVNAALSISRGIAERLETIAVRTGGTLADTIGAFRIALPLVLRDIRIGGREATKGVAETLEVVKNLQLAAIAIGIPAELVRIQIDDILKGVVTTRTLLAKVLDIQQEQLRRAREMGQIVPFVNEKLRSFRDAQDQILGKFAAIANITVTIGQLIAKRLTAGGFILLRDTLKQLNDSLIRFNKETKKIEFRPGVVKAMEGAQRAFTDFVKLVIQGVPIAVRSLGLFAKAVFRIAQGMILLGGLFEKIRGNLKAFKADEVARRAEGAFNGARRAAQRGQVELAKRLLEIGTQFQKSANRLADQSADSFESVLASARALVDFEKIISTTDITTEKLAKLLAEKLGPILDRVSAKAKEAAADGVTILNKAVGVDFVKSLEDVGLKLPQFAQKLARAFQPPPSLKNLKSELKELSEIVGARGIVGTIESLGLKIEKEAQRLPEKILGPAPGAQGAFPRFRDRILDIAREQVGPAFDRMADRIADSFQRTFENILSETRSFGEAMKSLLREIAGGIVGTFVRNIVRGITRELFDLLERAVAGILGKGGLLGRILRVVLDIKNPTTNIQTAKVDLARSERTVIQAAVVNVQGGAGGQNLISSLLGGIFGRGPGIGGLITQGFLGGGGGGVLGGLFGGLGGAIKNLTSVIGRATGPTNFSFAAGGAVGLGSVLAASAITAGLALPLILPFTGLFGGARRREAERQRRVQAAMRRQLVTLPTGRTFLFENRPTIPETFATGRVPGASTNVNLNVSFNVSAMDGQDVARFFRDNGRQIVRAISRPLDDELDRKMTSSSRLPARILDEVWKV